MHWSRFFRRKHWDQERAREIEAYLEDETAENIARGMAPEEAKYAARRKLGNSVLIREEIYRMNSIGFMETLWQDLRYGLRVMRQGPGLTIVALLSLALGIGATTAMFSVIYGVIISPYPYAKPNEIWAPEVHSIKDPRPGMRPILLSEYLQIRKLAAFSSVMATLPENRILTSDRAPENFTAVAITSNGHQFLGVTPLLGRTIMPSDLTSNGQAEPVVVLSFKAWQRLFDGSPDALGKTIILNDQKYTVIGVMPSRFGWWTDDGGWVPMSEDLHDDRNVFAIMRLAAGVSKQASEQQLQSLNLELAKVNPANYPKEGFTTVLTNYMDMTVASGPMQNSLTMLFGAVGFLLLIACANVANLQMARATARAREVALRMSIGATRGRIFRQLLTESVVLSIAGGILGILFAVGITKATVALMPNFYVPNEARITVNNYALLFTLGVSVLTGILFGLVPAFQCSRPDLVETLKDAGKGVATGAGGGKTRNLLVIVEVALSVVLLVGASLTIRGFVNLQRTDVGFQADRVLMAGLQLPQKRYSTYDQRVAFTRNVIERVRTIPGVQSVAIGNGGLPFGGFQSQFTIDGNPQNEAKRLSINLISADYSQTLGIPLRGGRTLNEQEIARAERVALINEAAAKLWSSGRSPIGGLVHLDSSFNPRGAALPPNYSAPISFTIVGIIADTKNDGLKNPPMPAIFVPYTIVAPLGRTLAVRTAGSPMLSLNAVRQEIRAIDKDQPLGRPITLEEVLGFQSVQPRFNMALFTFFGMLGLALAAVGIFSVLSYSVARRTHEIGVRMALGAERSDVLNLMLGMGGKLVLIGLGAGLVGSFILVKSLRSEVFDVPVTDPLSILGVVILLGATALLACFLPARRAAKLDPMIALRHE